MLTSQPPWRFRLVGYRGPVLKRAALADGVTMDMEKVTIGERNFLHREAKERSAMIEITVIETQTLRREESLNKAVSTAKFAIMSNFYKFTLENDS